MYNIEKEKYLILDTETTGMNWNDEIIEIAITDLDGNVKFESLVKPKILIPKRIQTYTGITNEMVENSPNWEEVWRNVGDIIQDKILIIYNADFDINKILYSCELHRIKKPIIKAVCVMKMYKRINKIRDRLKLETVVGYEIKHRAASDCRAVVDLIKKVNEDQKFLKELHKNEITFPKEEKESKKTFSKQTTQYDYTDEMWDNDQEINDYFAQCMERDD